MALLGWFLVMGASMIYEGSLMSPAVASSSFGAATAQW
jgi:hypothetical protein